MTHPSAARAQWRQRLHRIIFGVDTPAGRAFDVVLIWSILASVAVVMLDSVGAIHQRYAVALYALEWAFTGLFTAEYIARLLSSPQPRRYALSLYGLIDLLSVLPTYLSLVVAGTQALLVLRTLRLLRVFRVFKLTQYLFEADVLFQAVRASRRKITVFLLFVLSLAVVMGAVMYLVEGEAGGFTSIPRGMYWAIVTMTTVGYGDIAPRTVPGQILASALMIMGYGVLAVPTGIVSVELAQATRESARGAQEPASGKAAGGPACPHCAALGHDLDALFCKRCGSALQPPLREGGT